MVIDAEFYCLERGCVELDLCRSKRLNGITVGQCNFLIKFWPDRLLRFGYREQKGEGVCVSKRSLNEKLSTHNMPVTTMRGNVVRIQVLATKNENENQI